MQTPFPWLDRGFLAAIAQQVLRAPDAEVLSCEAEPISYVNLGENSRGLFRISGTAAVGADTRDWSFILKRFCDMPDGSTTAENSAHFWRREANAYPSGLLEHLPEGIAVPVCYAVEDMPDGSVVLCMEAIASATETPWPRSRFRLAAYHLGLFNGQFLVMSGLPQLPWLSRGMTQIWSEENAYTVDLIARPAVWVTAALKSAFPAPIADQLLKLWDHRAACFEALNGLPQTICHHDAGHRNLFDRVDSAGRPQTVLIDWELVGYGAVGEELGNLFGPALINFEASANEANELAETLLAGYLDGLHDAGWAGRSEDVRLGFQLSTLFRWLFPAAGWPIAIATDESGNAERKTLEQWGRPMSEVYRQWAGTAYFLCEYIENTLEQVRRRS